MEELVNTNSTYSFKSTSTCTDSNELTQEGEITYEFKKSNTQLQQTVSTALSCLSILPVFYDKD